MIAFFIRRKVTTSMLFLGLSLLGYISYTNLPVQLTPDATLPELVVQVNSARDNDPRYMERDVILPLEGAIGTLAGIEKIESNTNRRQGIIRVSYSQDENMKYAYLRLQEKVNAVKSSLPQEYFVIVNRFDTEALSNMLMLLQVLGEGGLDRVRHLADTKILPELEAIDGVASVQVNGGRERSVEVVINNSAAEAYGITPSQISNHISRYNQYRTYVGNIRQQGKLHFINVVGEYTSVWDLGNIVVEPTTPVLLKDVATIRAGAKEQTSISRVNGKESVTINIIRDAQANTLDLAEAVYPVIDRLNTSLASEGIEIMSEFDFAEYLRKNIDLVTNLALTGGFLAILILWFFLRNLRLILVVALSLPISILVSFNLFYAFGISINTLTLIGMALAVGMLLDNSIVVLENIYRLMQHDRDPLKASVEGVKEVWRSIVAATFTTIIIFLPFIFSTQFNVKLIAYQIGISIVSTLFVSLIVALLLIPMVTHYFLSQGTLSLKPFYTFSSASRLMQIYTVFLKSTMRFPVRTVIVTLLIFFTSLLITLWQSREFIQEAETKEVSLYVTMPAGYTLETADVTVRDIEEGIKDIPEIKTINSQIFEDEAVLTLRLKDDYRDIRNQEIGGIKADVDRRLDDFESADVSFDAPVASRRFGRGGGGGGLGGMGGFNAAVGLGGGSQGVIIKGEDIDLMRAFADDLSQQLRTLSTIRWAWVSAAGDRPELHLYLDQTLMSQYSIAPASIRSELQTFQPETGSGVRFKDGIDEYDIQIRNESYEEERTVEDLRKLPIPNADGTELPLSQFSEVVYGEGKSRLQRVNQENQIQVSYRFDELVEGDSRALELARDEVMQVLEQMEIPSGIAVEMPQSEDEFSEFYFLFAVAFILIYMILASVFESLLNPLIIMFTIPLAAIGSLLAIMITGHALLNINTLIGMLILLGIVVNNGIILIDYARQLRQSGYRHQRALLTSGQARLRPILITAITTIVALLPLAMGKVEYVTQLSTPFAITVIGGLMMSTVFTLVLIPTVYSGLESFRGWFNKLPLSIKLLQIALLALGGAFIYYNISSFVWQLANFFLILFIVPGVTYFVRNALRQASSQIIDPDEPINISIHYLHKIYDHPGRFSREWRKYDRLVQRLGKKSIFATSRGLWENSWHFLLFGFLIYFVFFYLDSGFWMFILSHFVYFYSIYLFDALQALFTKETPADEDEKPAKNRLRKALIWGLPAVFLVIFIFDWHNTFMISVIGFLWYFCLIVYYASNRIHRENIDINRIKGRFAKLRQRFYRMVKVVPIIGKKKQPFAALNGVSLEIGSGMFGLLGPNGAGKTTLMRTVCGILEQTYGQIRINGIDVKEKREELQGLIGYLPQDFGTYENMTAKEFLLYQSILKGLTDKALREERVNYVLSAVHLGEKQNDKIGSFSGGMKQRVGIAQTLLHLPRILVVDEPTAGLDPRERIRFRNLLVELSRERIVIFSTHVIEDIASSCDRVAVMNRGEVRYLGQPQEMADFARGNVWQFNIPPEEFDAAREKYRIVHHSKTPDEQIRLRCLSKTSPATDAESVTPTLEDAYLWLLSAR